MKLRTALKGATAPIALSVALIANPALAQDEGDETSEEIRAETPGEDEEPVGATGQASTEGAIFVTGSRIRRDEFSSASPITLVDPEIAVRQGLMDTGAMVQGSPIAAGSSQVTAAISTNFLTNGGVGAQTVSLRGLGAERTLVLLNGRRAGPAGTRGSVSAFDLNVLPQAIVERVDILKDGASSIYGSDAVAGVVNLITKTDTDGIELDLFGSVPFTSGGERWSASATWGKTFDRGHILVSANYQRQNELARGDRSYLRCPENYVFTDDTFSERADLIDPRSGEFACAGDSVNTWGHVWTYDYTYTDITGFQDFDFDGTDDAYFSFDGNANLGAPGGSNVPGSDGSGAATLYQYSYNNDNLGQYLPGTTRTIPGQIGVPDGWFAVGYDRASDAVQNNYHPLMDNDTVIPETDLYSGYLDAAYELTDGIEFYTELLYNRRDNFVNSSGQIYQFGLGEVYDYYYDYDQFQETDENGNPLFATTDEAGQVVFNTDGIGVPVIGNVGLDLNDPVFGFDYDPYAAGWVGPAVFSPTPFNPFVDSSVSVEYMRAVAGFRGDISPSWSYDIYGQWSRSDGTYRNQTALKDAIACANFRSGAKGYSERRCPGGVSPVSGRENVIVDWFSPRFNYGDYTQEEYDFLFAWDEGNTEYTQAYVEAIVTGDLIDLPWSGPVGVALGGTARRDEINDVPGEIRQADNGFNFGGAGVTAGKTETLEAFGEVNIPLLEDVPFFQSVNFTGAARVTNVTATRDFDGAEDTNNGNWTYKLGLDWQVNDWLRFRGTYGTSYRAPALFEQFLADQTGFLGQRAVDPCIQWGLNLAQGNISQNFADNCAADGVSPNHTGAGVSAPILSGGGLGVLDPETSRAWTASVVLTPSFSFLPNTRFSVAVDYFDIEVNGEIAQLGAAGVLSSCYSSDFFPDDPLCDSFYRFNDFDNGTAPADIAAQYDQAGGDRENVAYVADQFFNINSQQNRGVDVTTRIIHDFAGDTTLTIQGQMTWQTKDSIALFDGFEEDNNGEAGEPIFVGDFFAQLDTGPWSLFYGLDVIGGTDDREDFLQNNGTLCPSYVTLGDVCLKLTTDAQFYHAASITREIGENFRITAGMSNITNNRPPRTSQVGGDGTQSFGQGLFYSQYDLIGRRAFVNLNVRY
ncbi:TonB-dependent receptor domain-containing protein [Aurantiacibacter odishensis]|uniref:TonB-dependent receptor domain-containing protein n=1 Tax=Aurantiacibacter odishensis TaxID=1155476 RepID=UPI0013C4F683|nr:TonB-dependent receptor [Aurantiacibacter odishensis]